MCSATYTVLAKLVTVTPLSPAGSISVKFTVTAVHWHRTLALAVPRSRIYSVNRILISNPAFTT